MEGDGLGLDLALLDIDLVTAENDGDVLADTDKITCRWGALAGLEFLGSRKKAGLGGRQRERAYGASWERSCR